MLGSIGAAEDAAVLTIDGATGEPRLEPRN